MLCLHPFLGLAPRPASWARCWLDTPERQAGCPSSLFIFPVDQAGAPESPFYGQGK